MGKVHQRDVKERKVVGEVWTLENFLRKHNRQLQRKEGGTWVGGETDRKCPQGRSGAVSPGLHHPSESS